MKLNVNELQQLVFEIEGKLSINQSSGERTVEMSGILKTGDFSQGEKLEFRKKSTEVGNLLKVVEEQRKALLEDFFDNLGTPEAKLKEGKTEADLNAQYSELFTSEHELEKISGITADQIKNIKGTSDFYDILIKLQSS